MRFDLTAALRNLHCTTPTDPSGTDEPYAWILFVKLDGSTIRQRFNAANQPENRLSAAIHIESGPGGHKNLASSSAVSGSNIVVPPSVGRHASSLRPILIHLEGATQTIEVYVPGSLFALALVIDEDSVPAEAPLAAFAAVKDHIERRLNDAINDLDLSGIILGAIGAMSRGEDPGQIALAGVMSQLTQLQQSVQQEAIKLATERAKDAAVEAADLWNPIDLIGLGIAALDPDEVIGAASFLATEQTLTGASLAQQWRADVRQSATGLGGAWYSLSGAASGFIDFFPGDIEAFLSGPPRRKNLRRSVHTVKVGRRCLKAGTRISLTRIGFTETHIVCVKYPFLTYRYFLDDIELVGDQEYSNEPGSIEIPNKTVSFPQFDESKFYLIGERQETRTVKVSFERRRDPLRPQLVQILLRNTPSDGCYGMTMRIEAVLPNGQTIPAGLTEISVTGEVLETPDGLLERYMKCVAEHLKSLHVRVKPTIPAQWRTPEIKWQQLELATTRLGELRKAEMLSTAGVDRVRRALARKLGLG